jgi:hypothetical protein
MVHMPSFKPYKHTLEIGKVGENDDFKNDGSENLSGFIYSGTYLFTT